MTERSSAVMTMLANGQEVTVMEPKTGRVISSLQFDLPYIECERATAGPMTPVHLRRSDGEKLKYGGGLDVRSLCGMSLILGWDIRRVDAAEVRRTVAVVKADQPGRLCAQCVAVVNSDTAP